MQVFRLVKGGFPDSVIAFDALPEEMVARIPRRDPAGLPRHWARFLTENGSVDKAGKPVFFVLDYLMTNNDKEAWQNINSFVRRVVETRVRLKDKLEDMAKPMASSSTTDLTLEPEEIEIIPVPKEASAAVEQSDEVMEAAIAKRKKIKNLEG